MIGERRLSNANFCIQMLAIKQFQRTVLKYKVEQQAKYVLI